MRYIAEHQAPKDILRIVLICVHEGIVRCSKDGTYRIWNYITSMWIEELDFDNAVEVAKMELTNRNYPEFDNNHRLKFCALLKFAEKKNQLGQQWENGISLKLDDFRDVCEKYGVEILG